MLTFDTSPFRRCWSDRLAAFKFDSHTPTPLAQAILDLWPSLSPGEKIGQAVGLIFPGHLVPQMVALTSEVERKIKVSGEELGALVEGIICYLDSKATPVVDDPAPVSPSLLIGTADDDLPCS